MVKICILMATYNGDKYITEQIESILNQKNVDVTLFVSDDMSTDCTVEMLLPYSKLNNFCLLGGGKRYGTAGKNFYSMIERVDFRQFDYVGFADQDDIWFSDKLFRCVKKIESITDCVGVSSCVEAFWEDGRSLYVDKAAPQRQYDYLFEPAGPGCTYLFTASFAHELKQLLLKKPSIYDAVFAHDWLVYAFARSRGYEWCIIPEATMKYRQHSNNETGVNSGKSAIKARLLKLKTGWYLDQVYAIANAVEVEDLLKLFFSARGCPNLTFFLNFRQMRRKLTDAVLLNLFFLTGIVR